MLLKLLDAFGELARAEHKHTSSKRVERSGMTHLQFLHSKTHTQTLAHKGKSAEARHVKGFVDGDDFAFGEIHSLYVVYQLISSLSI